MPARTEPPERRSELLAAIIATVADKGIGDRSLRDLAGEVGTSHRMLLHHFGSRDELMVAIVTEVEDRTRAMLHSASGDPLEQLNAMWTRLRQPHMRPLERLFFECYARGAQGEAPFDRLVASAVTDWLAAASDLPGDHDSAHMRLGLAVIRGLLLDLVATNDTSGVHAAFKRYLSLLALRSASTSHEQI